MIRLALFATLPLLAACVTPGAVEAQPEMEADRPLTTWTFVAIDGQTPRSSKTELRIYKNRISATVGCNSLGGDYEMTNGQIKFGPIISTQMYCEDLMGQERAVAELFRESPIIFAENGRMAISSGKHMAELVRKAD